VRRAALGLLVAAALALPARAADPLPSWNEGPVRQGIVAFVAGATKPGSAFFVPPEERIAVFDNDGALWAEQPMYFQLAFALDRVRALAPQNPTWKTTEPFASILAMDIPSALAGGNRAVGEIVGATHAGMTTDEFAAVVADWLGTAKHPKTGRLYTEMVYQPMLELLAYLRANGFQTWIVSGGGVEFMRAFAERVYGIPPEQVVGSSGALRFELREGRPVLVKEAAIEFVDDGPGKPVGIQRAIGRRPVLAFGNSDGDLQMLQWTAAGGPGRFAGLIHHTDAEREWAYDKSSHVGRLDAALAEATAKRWTIVDMKRDWKKVFPFEP
jgi:phosphoglycolate phosphatase-like HAD superfamily hydrolase